jgi:hypothetical protein
MIQIDVHPAGENPTNMTRTLPTSIHVCPAYAFCRRSSYVATFCETPIDLNRSHCSPEKWLLIQSTARRLTDPGSTPSFSPEPANEVGGVSQAPDSDQLLGLLGPYHRHAIDTFNTCSRGSIHRFLIDTGGATTLVVPACHIPTPRPSQPVVSTFS